MPRCRTRALASLAATSVILSTAAAAPAQAEAALTGGLLGGLTGLVDDGDLGGVVDTLVTTEEPALTEVVTTLTADPTATTGEVLAPVTGVLTALAGDPAADAEVRSLLTELVAAIELAGTDEVTDPVALGALTDVLGQLGALQGVTELPQSLLTGLTEQLRAGDALDLTTLPAVQTALDALGAGEVPTTDLLAPVTGLLVDMADTSTLDVTVREMLTEATTLLTSGVDDATLVTVTGLLDRAQADPSVSPNVRYLIDAISTTLRPSSRPPAQQPPATPQQVATPQAQDPNWWLPYYYAWLASQKGKPRAVAAATSRDRAKVTSLRMSKDGRKVVARLACPRSAPAACRVTLSGKARDRRAARARKVTLRPGRRATRTLTLFRSVRSSMRRRGGKVYARATTRITTSRTVKFTHTRAVRVRAARR